MATHEQYKCPSNANGKQWHGDGCDEAPDDECVPFPLPDCVKQPPRMMAEMFDLMAVQWKAARVKEVYPQLNEGKKQKQVEWRRDVHADLRCDLIQAEDPGEQDHQERGETHGWVDAEDDA